MAIVTWTARCSGDFACPVRFRAGPDRLCLDHGADVEFDALGRVELAGFIASDPADDRATIDAAATARPGRASTKARTGSAPGR